MYARTLLAAVVLIASTCLPVMAEDAPDSCGSHDWFQLRQQVASGGTSLLCKGSVDASAGKQAEAEQELNAVIRQHPHSASSHQAHETLGSMYFRTGQYRKTLAEFDLALADKPDAEDIKAIRSLVAVLAQHPDLTVASSGPSTLPSETIENNVFVPVKANGVSGNYLIDTGANVSVICESEARRLGLKLQQTTSKGFDISGTPSGFRVTEMPDLWIGKTHLQHVAFVVYPDANQPFVDLPKGHKGVLGIPVLIALGTFRLTKGNRFEINVGSAPTSTRTIPLAFDDMTPVTQMSLNGKTLNFTFDTGADSTYLGPVFAAAFPELMRTGSKQDHKLTGLSGSTVQESIVLTSVRFSLGGDVELAPATVLLKTTTGTSEWAAGNLGFDLMKQTLPMTIDFRAMQLSFEGH